jgi:hypothetical protein
MNENARQQFSIWSTFDNILKQAEHQFYEYEFEQALKHWQEYAEITGENRWRNAYQDLKQLLGEYSSTKFKDPQQYFSQWLQIRHRLHDNLISPYAFECMERLYARIFLATKTTVSFDLATGIFCYIDDRIDKALDNLNVVINQQPDNLLARIFLNKCYYKINDEENGNAYLTQALFLGGNEIIADDIGSVTIKNLHGRLKSLHGKGEAGLWLVPFEGWFRNWLIWKEDISFFQVMQQKERNERILQVKYYASEKYRHFVRCLYIAEYVRQFLAKEKGIIWEQEAYMEKLDNGLYQRYRKKRKPVA